MVTTAGAPPSPTTIEQCERLNARVVHVYGLTETYGPYSVCQWQEGWEDLGVERARGAPVPPGSRDDPGRAASRGRRRDERRAGGRHDDGRDRHARQQRHEGLFRGRGGDGRGVQGRLVSLRRPRGHAARRLCAAPGPRQGRRHIRRGEHLHRGDRAGAPHPRGRAGGGGHRGARREVGRAAQGLRRAQARREGQREGDHRPREVHDRPLQGARSRRLPGRAAKDLDGQGPEVRAPGARVGRARTPASRGEGHRRVDPAPARRASSIGSGPSPPPSSWGVKAG